MLAWFCRDRAQQVAKDEIAEMNRKVHRGGLDVEYLKAVLVDGFEAGELPVSSQLYPVLSRLLSFSPDDRARAISGVPKPKGLLSSMGSMSMSSGKPSTPRGSVKLSGRR